MPALPRLALALLTLATLAGCGTKTPLTLPPQAQSVTAGGAGTAPAPSDGGVATERRP